MNNRDFLQRLFASGNSYWLTRFVILRLLGFEGTRWFGYQLERLVLSNLGDLSKAPLHQYTDPVMLGAICQK